MKQKYIRRHGAKTLAAGLAIASALTLSPLAANTAYLSSVSGDAMEVELSWGTLNVRSGAGLGYAVVDSLTDGEIVTSLASGGGWTRVRYGGTKLGFVSSAYLKPTSGTVQSKPAESEQTSRSLAVPYYSQTDPRWSSLYIGSSTIGRIGCTTTCLAMSESYRTGAAVTPAAMRSRLRYTSGGALYWPSNYTFYYGSGYAAKIKTLLDSGRPVLIGSAKTSGGTHWVVAVGYKNGGASLSDFTINDPGSGNRATLAQFMRDYPSFIKLAWYE